MNQVKTESSNEHDKATGNCNVSMTYNFTVGGIAVAAALIIGYLAYNYWWK
nr:hypothetical protein [Nitrosomonas nitrosa]